MKTQLTIRGVPVELAQKLQRLSQEKGSSVNSTVLEILHDALGESPRRDRLARYATWTPSDVAEVEDALGAQRVVDEKLWR